MCGPITRNIQRDQMQGLIAIPKVGEVAQTEAMRIRPLDVTRGDAWWQRPFDFRRLPGVAGIAPVGVPAGIGLEAQSQRVVASMQCSGFTDQFDLDVRGTDRSCVGLH